MKELDERLEDFKWVHSVCFIIRYIMLSSSLGESTYEMMQSQGKINMAVDDINLAAKKFDFVSLNNISRLNREIMLQYLYMNDSIWVNNLISARHNIHAPSILAFSTGLQFIKDQKYFENDDIRTLINCFGKNFSQAIQYYQSDDKFLTFIKDFCEKLANNHVYPVRYLDDRDKNLNDNFNSHWFYESVFSLIGETHNFNFSHEYESPLITEKTVKAIMNFHPFIIYGHANTHRFLQNIGFKTFEYLLDLPADGQIGNRTTFERIFNIINGLKKFKRDKVDYERLQQEVYHNHYHFVNKDHWTNLQIRYLLTDQH